MKQAAPLLCMPALHSGTLPEAAPHGAKFMWPGLPNCPTDGYWLSPDYPFTPQQAAACLDDMRAMSEAALSGVPLQALAAQQARPEALRSMEERDALARFAQNGEEPTHTTGTDMPRLRAAAQKALLWAWLLEERNRELRDLSQDYTQGVAGLAASLGVEHDEDAMAALAAVDTHLADDSGLLPPWKLVLENAALFFPQGTNIWVATPTMRDDVQEILPLAPMSPEDAASLGLPEKGLHCAEAPLWRILGHSASRPASPWLDISVRIITSEEHQ